MLEVKDGTMRMYGEIGGYLEGGIGSTEFAAMLDAVGSDDLTINIQSNGGDVFEGLAIYNQLRRHQGKVTVIVDSIAASIASVISMAGDSVLMMPQSFMMIHNPWTAVVGDAGEMRGVADLLDLIGGQIADIYAERSWQTVGRFLDLMAGETWLTAQDAIELGLADGMYNDTASIENARETADPIVAACGFSKRIAAAHGLRRSRLR